MRCLLTGATGFLGQELLKQLNARGHECLGLARRRESVAALNKMGAQGEVVDLLDRDGLAGAMKNYRPDAVFHLAAEIATQRNQKLIYRVNVDGTRALAESCRGLPLKAFVHASTVVMGDPKGEWIDETSQLIATTAYGKSKQQAEALLLAEMKEHGLPAMLLRPSHVYGPGGWYGDIIRDMRKGLFMVPGDGKNWWDVVHVEDVALAFLLAGEKPIGGETFHIVDDEPILMDDFFNLTAAALNLKSPRHVPKFIASIVRGSEPISAAVRSARSRNKKLKERLGWRPKFPNAQLGVKDCIARLAVQTN